MDSHVSNCCLSLKNFSSSSKSCCSSIFQLVCNKLKKNFHHDPIHSNSHGGFLNASFNDPQFSVEIVVQEIQTEQSFSRSSGLYQSNIDNKKEAEEIQNVGIETLEIQTEEIKTGEIQTVRRLSENRLKPFTDPQKSISPITDRQKSILSRLKQKKGVSSNVMKKVFLFEPKLPSIREGSSEDESDIKVFAEKTKPKSSEFRVIEFDESEPPEPSLDNLKISDIIQPELFVKKPKLIDSDLNQTIFTEEESSTDEEGKKLTKEEPSRNRLISTRTARNAIMVPKSKERDIQPIKSNKPNPEITDENGQKLKELVKMPRVDPKPLLNLKLGTLLLDLSETIDEKFRREVDDPKAKRSLGLER